MQNLVPVNGFGHYALTQCLSLTNSLKTRHRSIRRSHASLTMPSISFAAPRTMPNARKKNNANIFIRSIFSLFLSLKVNQKNWDSQAFHGLSASSSPIAIRRPNIFPLLLKDRFSEWQKYCITVILQFWKIEFHSLRRIEIQNFIKSDK